MSITSEIRKNTPKEFCLKQIDTSESKLSFYFLFLTLFVIVRSLLVLGFRCNEPDYIAVIEVELAVISLFLYFLVDLFFAFLIKFLSHKKDTPYKQVMTVLIFAKVNAPVFILLSALLKAFTSIFFFIYAILNTVYMHNNLKPDNKSKVWFWILLILTFLSASADLFNFNNELVQENAMYFYHSRINEE
ncbi:hypothetical protein BDAP_000436 [Binucleata daphniae]